MQYFAIATNHLRSVQACILVVLFAAAGIHANAEVVIEDAFNRTGPLAKSPPAPVNGPGAIWACNAAAGGALGIFTENGALKISNLNEFASLPFTFLYVPQNYLISLSANITLSTGKGKSWIGFGFAGDNRLFRAGTAWLRLCTNGKSELVKGPGYASCPKIQVPVTLTADKPAKIEITFNTGTNTATFIVNGEKLGVFSYNETPPVDRIFLSTSTDSDDVLNGMLQNLKLEVSPIR
ncbi:MAG: hypothetical protein ACFUZC_08795 [Chthoniobacteraceae bacterium]